MAKFVFFIAFKLKLYFWTTSVISRLLETLNKCPKTSLYIKKHRGPTEDKRKRNGCIFYAMRHFTARLADTED
jgi:hypothetical protein